MQIMPQRRHVPTRTRATRWGAAAVEFALVCPLMLLLALACADFGRIAYYCEAVAGAARSGAETGASLRFSDYTRPYWEAAVAQAVTDEMENVPGFDPSELAYDLRTTTDSEGVTRVVVEVSYPFRTAATWPGLPSETQLTRRVEYRQFR